MVGKKFCENCGNELLAGAKFCDSCGARIKTSSNLLDSWYSQNIAPLVRTSADWAKGLRRNTLIVSVVAVFVVAIVSFLSIMNGHAIQKQLQATQDRLTSIASTTNQKLDRQSQELNRQSQELNQKTSQISALESDIKLAASKEGSSSGNISKILSSLSPSVVKIVCNSDYSGNNLQEGSGLLYHSVSSAYGPYYVETNLHVVQTSDGSLSQCLIAIYPDYTDTNNYLLYQTSGYQIFKSGADLSFLTPELANSDNAGTKTQLAQYAKERTSTTYCSSSSIGDHLSILGYPGVGGSSLTATDGIISGFEYDNGTRFIKTSAKIEQGNSGGVAIKDSGCILGIPTFVETGSVESIGRILDLNDLFSN